MCSLHVPFSESPWFAGSVHAHLSLLGRNLIVKGSYSLGSCQGCQRWHWHIHRFTGEIQYIKVESKGTLSSYSVAPERARCNQATRTREVMRFCKAVGIAGSFQINVLSTVPAKLASRLKLISDSFTMNLPFLWQSDSLVHCRSMCCCISSLETTWDNHIETTVSTCVNCVEGGQCWTEFGVLRSLPLGAFAHSWRVRAEERARSWRHVAARRAEGSCSPGNPWQFSFWPRKLTKRAWTILNVSYSHYDLA